MPAGTYALSVTGYQAANDAHLHVTLILRRQMAADQILASQDLAAGGARDGGEPGDIHAALSAPPASAACGDQLVTRVEFISGSSPYLELRIEWTTP